MASTLLFKLDPSNHRYVTALTHFAQSSKIETMTKEFDARLANRPFLVFDFRTFGRSTLGARVPESKKN